MPGFADQFIPPMNKQDLILAELKAIRERLEALEARPTYPPPVYPVWPQWPIVFPPWPGVQWTYVTNTCPDAKRT